MEIEEKTKEAFQKWLDLRSAYCNTAYDCGFNEKNEIEYKLLKIERTLLEVFKDAMVSDQFEIVMKGFITQINFEKVDYWSLYLSFTESNENNIKKLENDHKNVINELENKHKSIVEELRKKIDVLNLEINSKNEDNHLMRINELETQLIEQVSKNSQIEFNRSAEVDRLNETLSNLNTKISDKEVLLKEVEDKYKGHLINKHLNGKESLEDRELEFIEELYLQKNEIEQSSIKDKPGEIPNISNLYDKGKSSDNCKCGRPKSSFAKGCVECRKEADRIRKREEVDWETAWEMLWENLGIFQDSNRESLRFNIDTSNSLK